MAKITELERAIVSRWLTTHKADILGPTLDHAFPIDVTTCFDQVLAAIDDAEQAVWGNCNPGPTG
jgi:hypothetical protein